MDYNVLLLLLIHAHNVVVTCSRNINLFSSRFMSGQRDAQCNRQIQTIFTLSILFSVTNLLFNYYASQIYFRYIQQTFKHIPQIINDLINSVSLFFSNLFNKSNDCRRCMQFFFSSRFMSGQCDVHCNRLVQNVFTLFVLFSMTIISGFHCGYYCFIRTYCLLRQTKEYHQHHNQIKNDTLYCENVVVQPGIFN